MISEPGADATKLGSHGTSDRARHRVAPGKGHAALISSNRLLKSLRSLLLLAAFAVIAVVVGDYLGSRNPLSGIPPEALPALSEDIGAQSQSWRWTQSGGDSTRIDVSAEEFLQGTDGRQTVLRTVVLKIFHEESDDYDRVESAEMRMLDGGELFSEGETVMTLGISDTRSSQPVVVTATSVTFDPSANSARTDRPVRYEFDGGEGSSLGAVYNAASGTLSMHSDVRMERFGEGASSPSSSVRAGGLLYWEQEARIDLTGGAIVRQGDRWMECEGATLWLADRRVGRIDGADVHGGERAVGRETEFSTLSLEAGFGAGGELLRIRGRGDTVFVSTESGQRVEVRGKSVDLHYDPGPVEGRSLLRRIDAREAARARMDEATTGSRSTIRSDELVLEMRPGAAGIERVETLQRGQLRQVPGDQAGPSRTLEADRIRLRYGEGSRIEGLSAAGDARLVQGPDEAGGPELRTWSASLEAAFDSATAAISRIRQQGAFRFEDGQAGEVASRRGSADEADFELDGGALTLAGTAAVSDEGSTISADRIVLVRDSGRLEGDGSVTASVAPGGSGDEGSLPSGLFAGQQPVYASADSLISDPQSKTLEYRGGARLWQGRNRIDADMIALDREAVSIRALGNVATSWEDGGSGDGAPPVFTSVQAEEMLYVESTGEAVFRNGVDFLREGMRALSDELRTSLGGPTAEAPGSAVATGTVRIAEFANGSGTRGFGDRAEFRLADSEVTLTGEPARILGPDGTETRGGRLTFRATGDSLQVLGYGAERAYTYRPASE